MGRVIKFRAYPTHDKAPFMVYWDLDEGDNRWPDNDGSYEGWEVMQFTGLTDKNGNEIYEGDIIKDYEGDGAHIVEYFEDCFCLVRDDGKKRSPIESEWWGELEILGNIYEDSNLIEGDV